MSGERTQKVIQDEINTLEERVYSLKKELKLVLKECECLKTSLPIYPHSNKAYKKCMHCGVSVTMLIDGEEFRHEWALLNCNGAELMKAKGEIK